MSTLATGAKGSFVRFASEDHFLAEDVEGGEDNVVLRCNNLRRLRLLDLLDALRVGRRGSASVRRASGEQSEKGERTS